MPVKYAWPKTAEEVVNDIDNQLSVGWDTDSTLAMLSGFIEENCDPAIFEKYLRRIAAEDLKACS